MSALEEYRKALSAATSESDDHELARLADAAIAELEARYSDVVAEHENELALRLEAEAALEEAITYTIKYGPYQGSSRETVWADLRARAEEGRE